MFTVAVIEDDPRASARLGTFIDEFSARTGEELEIVEFHEPTRFHEGYRSIDDIVFMGIEMPT